MRENEPQERDPKRSLHRASGSNKSDDTEKFANGDTQQILFTDNKKFSDGTSKSLADTNMPQSGSLGFPLEFDHVGFTFEFARGTTRPDFNILYTGSVFEWIPAQAA